MKGVGTTIAFWAASRLNSGGNGRDPLQCFETPVPEMMRALSSVGFSCVDANTDRDEFIETYLGGSTGASAATDRLAFFVPESHLTHPTPAGLPKHLRGAAHKGNVFRGCKLWRDLVEADGDFTLIKDLDSRRVYEPTGKYEVSNLTGDEYPVVRVVTEGPEGAKYRTTEQGHPRAAVLAASTLARDQPAEVDLRDELYEELNDRALADLWRKKKSGRLPPGSITSGSHSNGNATYNRALFLRKLKEAGIVPDESSDDDEAQP